MRPELQKLGLQLPIGIIGLGVSGRAVRSLLLAADVSAKDIFSFDDKEPSDSKSLAEFFANKRPKSICVSPGVALSKNEIKNFMAAGGSLTSELEIATAFLDNEVCITITGSLGKSTVTSLIGEAGKVVDQNIFVGGNLGIPLAKYSLDKITKSHPPAKFIVLELSSYQLENYKNLKASCGVLTFLSPNHMERYSSLHEYYDTKLQMVSHLSDFLICNASGGDIASYLKPDILKQKNLAVEQVDRNTPGLVKYFSRPPAILGKHNLDNLALAFKVCELFSWPQKSFEEVLSFKGLPHRFENCGEKSGILFINDSKATALDSVEQAFRSVREQFQDRCIHLLIGGKNKDLPWEKLNFLSKDNNCKFHFFGEVASIAQKKSNLIGLQYSKLSDCLSKLKPQIKSNEIVLFSPGGTSLDEFKNFEERGKFFKGWINNNF